jgi:hypothetical protein
MGLAPKNLPAEQNFNQIEREVVMALKRNANGTFTVRSQKEAIEALTGVENLKAEIEELKREHGILDMEEDATEMKKAAQVWCVKTKTDYLKLPGGRFARLIQAVGKREWIWSKRDLPPTVEAEGAIPLREIILAEYGDEKYRELSRAVTKRVVDPEKLSEAVAEGKLEEDVIAPAYVEKLNAPYLRVFEGTDGKLA